MVVGTGLFIAAVPMSGNVSTRDVFLVTTTTLGSIPTAWLTFHA